MASGHVNRIKRPNTWLHRPMLQNVKKALANTEPSTHGTNRTTSDVRSSVRYRGRLCKNDFPPPKTARNRGRSASTRRFEHIFAVSSLESTRAQLRATLSDLNGHTMGITARALHARIATRSGLMPTMFITRVRL
jgi:hypothetical protein